MGVYFLFDLDTDTPSYKKESNLKFVKHAGVINLLLVFNL